MGEREHKIVIVRHIYRQILKFFKAFRGRNWKTPWVLSITAFKYDDIFAGMYWFWIEYGANFVQIYLGKLNIHIGLPWSQNYIDFVSRGTAQGNIPESNKANAQSKFSLKINWK